MAPALFSAGVLRPSSLAYLSTRELRAHNITVIH